MSAITQKNTVILSILAIFVLISSGCRKLPDEATALAPLPPGINASGQILADVDWPDVYADPLKADYEITMNAVIEDNVMVRIAPGVVIKFTGVNSGITVSNGALVAIGTSENPISLEGSAESKGSWLGIRINTDNPANELQYCKIRYAGSDGNGALQIRGALNGTYPSFCKVTFCEVSQSSSYGLYIDKKSDIVFGNNTLTNNDASPARITSLQLGKLDSVSNYSNNTLGYIEVAGEGEISESIIARKLIVPYVVASGNVYVGNGNLTLRPGVEMRFRPNTGIEVRNAGVGSLIAIGTNANKITLKGVVAGQGGWNGIAIFGRSISNRFEYCTIDGGGQNPMGALTTNGKGRANIVVGNTANNIPVASFTNCTISNSAGFGIWYGGDASAQINAGIINSDVLTINTFTNNNLGSVGQ